MARSIFTTSSRLTVVCGLWLAAVGTVLADPALPNYSTDLSATRAQMQGFAKKDLPAFQKREYGNVDISGIAALAHNASLDTLRNANIQRINDCIAAANKSYAGMTDQQKLECIAVITAANNTNSSNPYLDPKNPETATTISETRAVQAQAQQNIKDGTITNPLTFTTSTQCGKTSTPSDPVKGLDLCHIERPVTPVLCTTPIAVSVTDGVITSTKDSTLCKPYTSNPYCEPAGTKCANTTVVDIGKPDGDGVTTPKLVAACVTEQTGFDCWDPQGPWDMSGCQYLASNPDCAPTGKTTPDRVVGGVPIWANAEYQCLRQPSVPIETDKCQSKVCIGNTCFDATPTKNEDLGQVAVGMEVAREAGVYATGADENSIRIFKGISTDCTRPTGPGIGPNCCKSSGGGAPLLNNRQVLPAVAMQVVGSTVIAGAGYGYQAASNYVYDFMWTSGNTWMEEKAWAALGSGSFKPNAAFNMSLSAYGFTMQVGATSATFTSLLPASETLTLVMDFYNSGSIALTSLSTTIGGTSITFAFNPYALAAMVAIQVIQNMMSCTPDDAMLAARRGGDLCAMTGGHCEHRLPWPLKTCYSWAEEWCCWNSKLAQTIAIQGRAQLNGGPPSCGGFSTAELAKIDFSKIDFSAFKAQMLASMVNPVSPVNQGKPVTIHPTIGPTAAVTVAEPVCTLQASPPTIAPGESSTLTAFCSPSATSFVWNGGTCAGTHGASCTVTPSATTVYTVTGANAVGSGNSAVATVTVAAPVCTLRASPPTIGPGESSTLTASCSPSAASFAWTGGTCAGTNGASCTVTPSATTDYSVTGTNSVGASYPARATVTVAAPVCSLQASPSAVGPGESSTLTASCSPSATSFVWTGGTCAGTNGASCIVTPSATTDYTLTGINNIGASAPASATVTVSAPVCTLQAVPPTIVPGDSSKLTAFCAPSAASFAWTGGTCAGTNGASCTVTPADTTDYTATGTNAAGTGNSAPARVTVATPICTLSASPPSVAPGETFTLTAICTLSPSSYAWSANTSCGTGSSATCSVTASSTATYSVTGQVGSAVSNLASATVTVTTAPVSQCGSGGNQLDSGILNNTLIVDPREGLNYQTVMGRGQSYSYQFTTGNYVSATDNHIGGFIFEQSNSGDYVQKFIQISEAPCDFKNYESINNAIINPLAWDACGTSGLIVVMHITIERQVFGVCNLKKNTTYYVNVRNESALYPASRGIDSCIPGNTCAYLFQYHSVSPPPAPSEPSEPSAPVAYCGTDANKLDSGILSNQAYLNPQPGLNYQTRLDRGQSASFQFTTGSVAGGTGSVVLEMGSLGDMVQKFAQISTSPCDFKNYKSIDDLITVPLSWDGCATSDGVVIVRYVLENPGSPQYIFGSCSLQTNKTYYLNVRNEAALYPSQRNKDTCLPGAACALVFQIH